MSKSINQTKADGDLAIIFNKKSVKDIMILMWNSPTSDNTKKMGELEINRRLTNRLVIIGTVTAIFTFLGGLLAFVSSFHK